MNRAIIETLPELVKWLPWAHTEHGLMDTRYYIRSARITRARRQNFELLILTLDTNEVLGIVSLHRIDWIRRVAGIGYWTRNGARGKGYATEATRALVKYGFRTLALHRIEAHVALDNQPSQRVVQKLGFAREGIAREFEFVNGRFLDHIQYSAMAWEPEDGRSER